MPKSVKRYALNNKQLHILKLVYKFRFVTAPLMTQYKQLTSRQSIHTTLERLARQDHLAKRSSRNHDFQNKGNRYYLGPEGLKILRRHGFDAQSLHAMYKNKTVSEKFIDHNIEIFKVCLSLKQTYADTFQLFTKTELYSYDYFPNPKPDLYLVNAKSKQDYLLDVLADEQLFVMKKRIRNYIDHYESGEWDSGSQSDYPRILLICPDASSERKLQEYILQTLENMGMEDELLFYTTTIKALLASTAKIWTNAFEPVNLLKL